MIPHKHADLIKAWADGAEIQFLDGRHWYDVYGTPDWNPEVKFRVKPTKRVIWIIGPKEEYRLLATDIYEYRRLFHPDQLMGFENPEIIWSENWWKYVDSPFDLLEMIMSRTR